jgi:hypothetical protein
MLGCLALWRARELDYKAQINFEVISSLHISYTSPKISIENMRTEKCVCPGLTCI